MKLADASQETLNDDALVLWQRSGLVAEIVVEGHRSAAIICRLVPVHCLE